LFTSHFFDTIIFLSTLYCIYVEIRSFLHPTVQLQLLCDNSTTTGSVKENPLSRNPVFTYEEKIRIPNFMGSKP